MEINIESFMELNKHIITKRDTLHVLLIEDNSIQADFVSSILSETNYVSFKTTRASSIKEALKLIGANSIDVILTEIDLPDSEGLISLYQIFLAANHLPVIILTEEHDHDLALQAISAGAQDFLVKNEGGYQVLKRSISYAIQRKRAVLLEQQKNEEALARAFEDTIEGWSRALELHDYETEGHTRRVTDHTLTMANAIGIKGDELTHLHRGTILHDIGKMGIPASLLNKPGRLTNQEREIMKKHTTYAYDMLYPIEFLQPAIDIPYSHHERWDGSGYPQGLKGTEIPLAARIFAVSDVWDALVTKRPYKEAWPQEKARQHIIDEAGKHFDPKIVSVFLELYQ